MKKNSLPVRSYGGRIRVKSAKNAREAILTLSRQFRHLDATQEPIPEPFRPLNDEAALEFIGKLLDRTQELALEYENALLEEFQFEARLPGTMKRGRGFLREDMRPPISPWFDERRFHSVASLQLFQWYSYAKMLVTISQWGQNAVPIILGNPMRECYLANGESASDLAVRLQVEVFARLTDMLPTFRYDMVRATVGTEAALLDMCGWVYAGIKSYDQLDETLLDELPAAVAVAIGDSGPPQSMSELKSSVRKVLRGGISKDRRHTVSLNSRHEMLVNPQPGPEELFRTKEEARRLVMAASKSLTGLEFEVLKQTVNSKTSAIIAEELGISPSTVRTHLERAREKLKSAIS